MKTLHYSIVINGSKQKVWETMLGDATYREWTSVFDPGSHYVGNWEEGSKILFLGPTKEGKSEGMVSMIAESRPYDFMSIKHLGVVKDGVEDTSSPAVEGWAGAFENYTFTETDGGTEVKVDLDVAEEHADMFEEMWPKGLAKLKALVEKS